MKKGKTLIAGDDLVARIRETLEYCPESGLMYWKAGHPNKSSCRRLAGTWSGGRYVRIGVMGRLMLMHRVVWAYVHGHFPSVDIDHINGCKTDNRIENLRPATKKTNNENQIRPRRDNTSGYLGVCWAEEKGRWKAQIQTDRKNKCLGYFEDPAVAHQAYLQAKRERHLGCTI